LTKKAILAAIEQASSINYRLFEAQQTRRILDRLVGYQISPLLWDKVRRGLSAGRVQSVAVRMVCTREEEIAAFKSEEYWSLEATLRGQTPPDFAAQLDQIDGHKAKVGDEASALQIKMDLQGANFVVTSVEKKQKKRHPAPPFITSSLQIEANRKLHYSAKKTMSLAQRLYEGIELGADGPTGLITYMRTDSTRINDDALAEVRGFIEQTYGQDLVPAKPNLYKTKKSAQDAHEAIRPTDVTKTPEGLKDYLDRDMLRLYTLIWKRFVASQMAAAIYDQTSILIGADRYQLKAVGSIIRFMGFMTLYVEATGDEAAKEGEEKDMLLPNLAVGAALTAQEIVASQHFTQPPPRYTEASLVKALEDNGVGRPSTYATILSTIQEKEYALLEQRKFFPTDLGILINGLLLKHFPAIMDIEFTASMEEQLDQVEEGKVEWLAILRAFYGPFKEALTLAKEEMASVKRAMTPTDVPCALCDGKMVIRWGKNGEFLACETYPACKNTQDFSRGVEGTITPIERDQVQESGEQCEKCGKPMVYKQGKFGRFLACSGYPQCRHILAETTGVTCPEANCSGIIVKKISKRGKVFFACNQYPKCNFGIWDKPIGTPCPQCGASFLVEKSSKKAGATLQCLNKECGYLKSLEEEP
jgi:DNA topoisomerase-1